MSDIEYKVGQEVWFIDDHKEVLSKPIISVYADCLWFEDVIENEEDDFFSWSYSIDIEHVAPTKEALRIKVFGE